MIRTLGAIAMLSGLLVVLVFQYTEPIIAENQRIAIEKAQIAGLDLQGCAAASDGFFPFADGLQTLAQELDGSLDQAPLPVLERVLQRGAGGHDLGHLAAHDSLGLCRILHLFADSPFQQVVEFSLTVVPSHPLDSQEEPHAHHRFFGT